jgi:hypothetical protein
MLSLREYKSISAEAGSGVPWPFIALVEESHGTRAANRFDDEATAISRISAQHSRRRSSAQWARSNSALTQSSVEAFASCTASPDSALKRASQSATWLPSKTCASEIACNSSIVERAQSAE